ncbi:hypothetical protein AVV36_gp147 [Pectobacterium bacteriophage PM2]|uniref:Uncharacterized protein n=1 Tax=Pectobacterium bacteriophage PM2 TaxID=1429794 RepID=A0A0A0PZI2_9CAUD|nr:hypothetical protein AVV36_gp147 [Pectobacterium bacteriophage PM2]AHY25109.1 hypothetical protein PM2_147 [Pectobacterium bacteriophage PM2]
MVVGKNKRTGQVDKVIKHIVAAISDGGSSTVVWDITISTISITKIDRRTEKAETKNVAVLLRIFLYLGFNGLSIFISPAVVNKEHRASRLGII